VHGLNDPAFDAASSPEALAGFDSSPTRSSDFSATFRHEQDENHFRADANCNFWVDNDWGENESGEEGGRRGDRRGVTEEEQDCTDDEMTYGTDVDVSYMMLLLLLLIC
jgi:hypothetical protein